MLGLLIGAFHQRHRLWLLSIRRKSLDAQTGLIYHALRKKLGILGYLAQPGDTPLQYAERLTSRLMLIESEGETWLGLSQIYSRLCYGNATVTAGEYQQFVRYYEHFCKNCRSLCSGGYFWKQFRL
jgi:hypothetical protein